MPGEYRTTIINSTVGAVAVGGGTAESRANSGRSAPSSAARHSFEFKADNATREQIERWLISAAESIGGTNAALTKACAHTSLDGSAKAAWSIAEIKK